MAQTGPKAGVMGGATTSDLILCKLMERFLISGARITMTDCLEAISRQLNW